MSLFILKMFEKFKEKIIVVKASWELVTIFFLNFHTQVRTIADSVSSERGDPGRGSGRVAVVLLVASHLSLRSHFHPPAAFRPAAQLDRQFEIVKLVLLFLFPSKNNKKWAQNSQFHVPVYLVIYLFFHKLDLLIGKNIYHCFIISTHTTLMCSPYLILSFLFLLRRLSRGVLWVEI